MRPVEDKGIPNFEPTHEISGTNSISFEFHKGNGKSRGSHRMPLGKPTPSKWDDAQKWLVGLSRGAERSHATTKPRNSNADDRRLIAPVPQKEDSSSTSSDGEEDGSKHHRGIILEEGETKKIDSNESFWRINKPSDESSSSIRSICVRDMGTEMTPIASQEPSRTPTPIRATTPSAVSPISSRSSTPGRRQQGAPSSLETYHSSVMCTENRNEPMPSGRAVGATRWSNREEEESNASRTYKNKIPGQPTKPNPLEIRAMAWDEAERAKYLARYKREEVKIQAWENHEKRKAEMEMKRIEVKAERLKSRAQEKLANKLAATRRIAEEKRANAEAKLNEQAARTSERADYMRRTGHLPSFSLKMPSLCW